jgi:excisionase family DNA binding protein
VAKLNESVEVAEAAEIRGVSPETVRTWAADGKIPMHRNPANSYRLFTRDDSEKFQKVIAKPLPPRKN